MSKKCLEGVWNVSVRCCEGPWWAPGLCLNESGIKVSRRFLECNTSLSRKCLEVLFKSVQVKLGQVKLEQAKSGQVNCRQIELGQVKSGQANLGQVNWGQVK